ncbi:MAG: ATP-binding cassette domain-containing protein [Vicinamibacterales bacterium]|nr:ATP-binding cassette domain-containing protein [Vicinamibacterales bacterium]
MVTLSVEHVRKQFRSVTAVDDLSFDVTPGEVFALLGPNGAGKTTMVRLLLGIMKPDAGRIHWQLDARSAPPGPRDIGYLPEDRGLYRDQPLLRTLVYFGALRGMSHAEAAAEGRRWLDRFDLASRAHDKLETLSKGNQQKMQFVAALLHRPRVAILDEPFSGLDPVNQDLFLDIIRELRSAGTTIILSAHQMDLVERLADRVLLMARGRALLNGTLAEVRCTAAESLRLVMQVAGAPDVRPFAETPGIVEARIEGERLTLLMSRDADLNRVLAVAAGHATIRAVHSETVSLHDIYVRTVKDANESGGAAGAEQES